MIVETTHPVTMTTEDRLFFTKRAKNYTTFDFPIIFQDISKKTRGIFFNPKTQEKFFSNFFFSRNPTYRQKGPKKYVPILNPKSRYVWRVAARRTRSTRLSQCLTAKPALIPYFGPSIGIFYPFQKLMYPRVLDISVS